MTLTRQEEKDLGLRRARRLMVGATDFTAWADAETEVVFFCVSCHRDYFDEQCSRGQLEQTIYFAWYLGPLRWKCVRCAGPVTAHHFHGRPTAPILGRTP